MCGNSWPLSRSWYDTFQYTYIYLKVNASIKEGMYADTCTHIKTLNRHIVCIFEINLYDETTPNFLKFIFLQEIFHKNSQIYICIFCYIYVKYIL